MDSQSAYNANRSARKTLGVLAPKAIQGAVLRRKAMPPLVLWPLLVSSWVRHRKVGDDPGWLGATVAGNALVGGTLKRPRLRVSLGASARRTLNGSR